MCDHALRLLIFCLLLFSNACSATRGSQLNSPDDGRPRGGYWAAVVNFVQEYCVDRCRMLLRQDVRPALQSAGDTGESILTSYNQIMMIKNSEGDALDLAELAFQRDLDRRYLLQGMAYTDLDLFLRKSEVLSVDGIDTFDYAGDDDFKSIIDSDDEDFHSVNGDESEEPRTAEKSKEDPLTPTKPGKEVENSTLDTRISEPGELDGRSWTTVKVSAKKSDTVKNLGLLLDQPLTVVSWEGLLGQSANALLSHGSEISINNTPYVMSFAVSSDRAVNRSYTLSFFEKKDVEVEFTERMGNGRRIVSVKNYESPHFTISSENYTLGSLGGFHISVGPSYSRKRYYYSYESTDLLRATYNGEEMRIDIRSPEFSEMSQLSKIFRSFVTTTKCHEVNFRRRTDRPVVKI